MQDDRGVEWTGGCLCGAVRYEVRSAPLWVCHCHCTMCRKQSGTGIGTFVGFPAGTVTWSGAKPTRYRSSKDVERSFCATCGSPLAFHRVHETSLALGSLDHPERLPVEGRAEIPVWSTHVWYQDRLAWFDTADGWSRHLKFPPGREEELAELSGQAIRG